MPMQISTGIDKLVQLIKEKKGISLKDAAKELGVSVALIEEWANFLEEEGVVDYKYRLTGVYLVEREISDKYIAKNEKVLTKKKDELVNNIKSSTQNLDTHRNDIFELKGKAKELVNKVGKDFDHIKEDITYLKKLEDTHDELNRKIIDHDAFFNERIKNINAALDKERKKYADLVADISKKDEELKDRNNSVIKLRSDEEKIYKDLIMMEKIAEKVTKEISDKNREISHDLSDINLMKKEIQSLREDMKEQRDLIDDLVKQKTQKEKEIESISKNLVKKITEKKKEIKTGMDDIEDIKKNLIEFLGKKSAIKQLLHDSDKDVLELEREISEVIRDANRLDRLSKSTEISKYSAEIKKAYEELRRKKDSVKGDFSKMSDLFHNMGTRK